MAQPLNGITILVTRPQGQAAKITQRIHALGGNTIHLPTIAITPSERADHAKKTLDKIATYSIGIFISSNAVDWTFKLCPQLTLQHLCLLSIGNATTTSLSKQLSKTQANTEKIITNPGNDHHHLLQLETLAKQQINGKKIIIFRGQGGNESLRNELLKRGASVDYAEVYSRTCPEHDPKIIAEIRKTIGKTNTCGIIIATSNSSLKNLFILCEKDHQLLQQQQLVIIGHRMLNYALTLGFTHTPIIAETSNDEGIIESIIQWSEQQGKINMNETEKPLNDQQTTDQALSTGKTDTAKTDTAKISTGKTDTAKTDAAKISTGKTDTAKTDTAKISTGKTDTAKTDTAKISTGKSVQQKPNKKCGKLHFFLLYLLILSIAGISYTLWEKLQQFNTELATVTQKEQQLKAKINQLQTQQIQHTDSLSALQNEHQKSIGHATLERLITIASHRLTLQNDLKTSIIALQSADKIIKNLADPRLFPVRQQLLADIAQLQTSAQIDTAGLALTIANSIQNIAQLPLKNNLPDTQATAKPEQTTAPKQTAWWKQIPNILWQELKTLIIISRTDIQHPATMLPETINLLHQNLTLELINARQAILNRDTENLRASIKLLRSWLIRYFDLQNPSVIQLNNTLRHMQNIELKPTPSDLNKLLKELHNAQTRPPQ